MKMTGSFWGKLLFLTLLMMPTTLMIANQGKASNVAFAQDTMEGEDDEATVETDTGDEAVDDSSAVTDQEEEDGVKPHPDADSFTLFTKPSNPLELPAGKQVRIVVGFTNKGNSDFQVDNIEASFRYPQDYSFFLQNFTTMNFGSVVESKKQATFEYGFVPNEAFSSRPFGLAVLINYKDTEGNTFQNVVYNETIQVIEPDEGLDGETFFLYVFLAAIVVLLLVGAHQMLGSFGKKRGMSKPRQPIEMGTQNSDIDYDWLPKETLQNLNKSPRRSPKQSPRQRRNLRSSGSKDD